jgi:hypothetical protein
MTAFLGIIGAAGLFALFGLAATRRGSRLERETHCQGDSCSVDSCVLHGGCETRSSEKSPTGWWSDEAVTYGEPR